MSYPQTAQTRPPADSHRGLRLFGLAAVVVGLLLLAAAAFALSYAGIHVVALSAGVSPRLARIYPLIFDAMLVVACSAVLSLRGAGVPSRLYAWLSMLALFAAAAGADTLHATGARLPHKQAAAAAAIIPWALVLIGFGLLLCMLRQARLRRAGALPGAAQKTFQERPGHVEVRASIHELIGATVSAGPAAAGPGPGRAEPSAELAIETDPGQDDPASDEGLAGFAQAREQRPGGNGHQPERARLGDGSAAPFNPAPTMPLDAGTPGVAPPEERGPGPDEADRAFLALRAPTEPGGGRTVPSVAQVPPHPRPAPEAALEPQPDPWPVPGPAAPPQPVPHAPGEVAAGPQPEPSPVDTATEAEPEPAPVNAAAEPEPEPAPVNAAAEPEPEPAPVDTAAEPQPGPEPAADPGAEGQPDSQSEPPPDAQLATAIPLQARSAPEADAPPPPVPSAEAEVEAEARAEADGEPQAEPDAPADAAPEPETDPGPETDPTPHFDRMRSSPIPPEG
jgi:hypothetical protein